MTDSTHDWTAEALRAEMEKREWAPFHLALRIFAVSGLEVSERQVSRWRKGERIPSDEQGLALARVFDAYET
ncbi:hypothetical protein ACH4TC_18565 [Streptomyces spororaveus]|uniref:hypothetical protein n=1 Tax=Streptomyces spororaveus TaxID=284039 RepID=UPI0037A5E23C